MCIFPRRQDAKTAVCLLAISQGVEEYYRLAAREIANVITPELRAFANEQILPLLNEAPPSVTHTFAHPIDRNGMSLSRFTQQLLISVTLAYGCTLTVGIGNQEIDYPVEPEFGSKADAKVATLLQAAKNGLIESIYHGCTPPEFGARWGSVEMQVDSMPIAVMKPLKRKREDPGSQALLLNPIKQDSSKSKERRRRRQALAAKISEAKQFTVQVVTGLSTGPPQLSIGIPSEKAMGKRPAIAIPSQSNGAFTHPLPQRPPHFERAKNVQAQVMWPPCVPSMLWGISNQSLPPIPSPMPLQPFSPIDPYQAHAYPAAPPPQTIFGFGPGSINSSFQGNPGMRFGYGDSYPPRGRH
ncbi:hypothetical protein C0991_005059 [Blastosporella zonata]|nr:hypothetical protein C0991_005059 [Blastosporella zonata]